MPTYSSRSKVIVGDATDCATTTTTSTMSPPHTTTKTPCYQKKPTRKEWPEFTHGRAIGMREAGLSFAEISRWVKIPASTLSSAYQRYQATGSPFTTKRAGCPQKITSRGSHYLLIASKRHREMSYAELRKNFASLVSVSTIKRRLAEFGVHKHIKAERPRLTPHQAWRRYQWCLKHRHWTVEEWKRVVWSDECSVEKSSNPDVQWVFRTAKEK